MEYLMKCTAVRINDIDSGSEISDNSDDTCSIISNDCLWHKHVSELFIDDPI
jgi:hypothetical protein